MFEVRALTLVGALVCAAPAMAHPDGDFTGLDYLKGTGWGLLGGGGGILGGALVGTAFGDHDATAWGAILGYTVGSAWAIYASGENNGHSGSFLWTVGSGTAGLAVGALTLYLVGEEHFIDWVLPTFLVLPLAGALAGYALSVEERPTDSAPMSLSVPLFIGSF